MKRRMKRSLMGGNPGSVIVVNNYLTGDLWVNFNIRVRPGYYWPVESGATAAVLVEVDPVGGSKGCSENFEPKDLKQESTNVIIMKVADPTTPPIVMKGDEMVDLTMLPEEFAVKKDEKKASSITTDLLEKNGYKKATGIPEQRLRRGDLALGKHVHL